VHELYSHRDSPLHRLDARVKLLLTLALIVFLNLVPSGAWPAYILFLSLVMALVLLSRLGFRFVLARTLVAIPFLLAAVPLLFVCSEPRISVGLTGSFSIAVCAQGAVRFASIATKMLISVAAAVLLAATTRFNDLLAGLRQLRVPRLFVATIGLMWRYLFVIGDEALSLMRARASRSADAFVTKRSGVSWWWRAKVTGGMAGSLMLRSIERSDRVYAAMFSRGYNGEPPGAEPTGLSKNSRTILVLGIVLCMLLWLLGVLTGG
jgi:cobalt/nickel transport system permease protein